MVIFKLIDWVENIHPKWVGFIVAISIMTPLFVLAMAVVIGLSFLVGEIITLITPTGFLYVLVCFLIGCWARAIFSSMIKRK